MTTSDDKLFDLAADRHPRRSLAVYYAATFLWSWALFIPTALQSAGSIVLPFPKEALLLAGVFGPSVCSWVLTWRRGGKGALGRMIRSGFDPRIPASVYLFVIVVPVAVAGAGAIITGGEISHLQPLRFAGIAVLYFFLGGSFGEEFGWRGFALPRLLELTGPLPASLLLGVLWGMWHLPLFFVDGTSQSVTPFWLYVIYTTSLAVQYTWIFVRTRGNLFACLLMHTFTNLTVEIFPIDDAVPDKRIYYETALNVVIALCLLPLLKDRSRIGVD